MRIKRPPGIMGADHVFIPDMDGSVESLLSEADAFVVSWPLGLKHNRWTCFPRTCSRDSYYGKGDSLMYLG